MGGYLYQVAIAEPQKAALICGAEQISYAELDRSAIGLAHWLLGQGLEPVDRVALGDAAQFPIHHRHQLLQAGFVPAILAKQEFCDWSAASAPIFFSGMVWIRAV